MTTSGPKSPPIASIEILITLDYSCAIPVPDLPCPCSRQVFGENSVFAFPHNQILSNHCELRLLLPFRKLGEWRNGLLVSLTVSKNLRLAVFRQSGLARIRIDGEIEELFCNRTHIDLVADEDFRTVSPFRIEQHFAAFIKLYPRKPRIFR